MKLTFLPKILLAVSILTVTAVFHPSMSSVAYAQSKMSAPVTGQNLHTAYFPGGRFEQTGQGLWTEYDRNGARRYTFREVRRDRDTVFLREDALGVALELNATRRVIMAYWPGMARHQMHRINRVKAQPGTINPAPPRIQPSRPVVPPVVTPSRPVPAIVNPKNVAKVIYAGGRFEEAGTNSGIWTQFSNTGGVSTYGEIGHDTKNLYLFDDRRDVLVVLDVKSKIIRESRNGGVLKKQHSGVTMSR